MAKKFFYACAACLTLMLCVMAGAKMARGAATSGVPGEVAVLSGTINDGETIPLPTYSDGVQATESECRWTVGLAAWENSRTVQAPMAIRCETEGRVVHAYCCGQYDCLGGGPMSARANYLIIAVRGGGAVNTRTSSWGATKTSSR